MSIQVRFALDRSGFSLDIDQVLPGKGVTAVFGPSGSGKTTLLRVIAGLERVPGGIVKFADECWQGGDIFVPTHARRIGYVFQEASLFPHLNIRENLEYGLRRTPPGDQRVSLDEAVSLMGLGGVLERGPETLSGGEQQRVAIARALVTSPRLLLMDEPLASLDNKLKRDILPYLESLHRALDIPVLYVSHATDEVARLADHLLVLKAGRVLGAGPIRDMLTRLDLPPAHRQDAETLIEARVLSIDEEYGLSVLENEGFQFTVLGTGLEPGSIARLRIAAHDVSLTLERQENTSIQNIFPVVVVEYFDEGPAQVMIKLKLGNSAILARLTRKSVAELKIHVGKTMFAQIKSVAVLA